ncbi:IBR domain, a half RING-finger domain-containing protein [Ditylenchus destructor]|nr:IBR domain, a half RING-finger domain-containing protein [Ditylenchus destructor]
MRHSNDDDESDSLVYSDAGGDFYNDGGGSTSSDQEIDEAGILDNAAAATNSNSQGLNAGQEDCQIFTEAELREEMDKTTIDTSAIIRYSPSICRTLLHYFKWNKETLLEKFYESQNADKLFRNARLLEPDKPLKTSSRAQQCKICFNTRQLTGLQCSHLFCRECWAGYLSCKIVDEGCPYVSCPQHKCDFILDDDKVLSLIDKEQVKLAYNRLVLNSYVESNSLLKWCPGTGCGRIVKVSHAESRPVKCDCGFIFCYQCSEHWHEPVSCPLLKRWLKKCSDDSETSNWLNANTKDCPQCKVTIEKDGGCNHMTCKNVSCRFEFCWMCLGPWAPHGSGWYSCNRYDDTAAKHARDEQEKSRAALQRYLHYYNRYSNHHNSLKLESKLYAQISTKMDHMQQHNFSWIETQFLRKAVDVLSECRCTLMYTYAFAYYLQQNNNTKIFEDNQQDLELATEQLSEFLERDLDAENLVTLKQKVQDKFRYVDQRREVLLKHCSEGYENSQWIFVRESGSFVGNLHSKR